MKFLPLASALCLSVVLTACGTTATTSASAPAKLFPERAASGLLTGPNGMTLYTFAKDGKNSGMSECYDQCEVNWPPLTVPAGTAPTGDYSLIIRMDGKYQVALKGQPLYYYAKDAKPGDAIGDGRSDGAWKVIKP